ncbi:hypothetical protein GCM10023321_08160 [Pseudonocardia eucalypti]|uniref:Lipoprotein n=1 Tax=Pseudonocardia eucalypti TaxID=648755 RepID=A0ABP9PJ58_9PSEU|nr:hypothetical protein [Pseudonocardia eucalypti]
MRTSLAKRLAPELITLGALAACSHASPSASPGSPDGQLAKAAGQAGAHTHLQVLQRAIRGRYGPAGPTVVRLATTPPTPRKSPP